MSDWEKFSIESCIRSILREASQQRNEHFGRPFLTAYQIAIALREKFPNTYADIGKDIGGKNSRVSDSLAKYMAEQLSKRIKDSRIMDIEGRFLCGKYLKNISYSFGEEIIENSTGTSVLSMFRLID